MTKFQSALIVAVALAIGSAGALATSASAAGINIGLSAKKGTKQARQLGIANTVMGLAMSGKAGGRGCNRVNGGQYGKNHKLKVKQKGCGNDLGVVQVGNGANTNVNQRDGEVSTVFGIGLD